MDEDNDVLLPLLLPCEHHTAEYKY